MPKRSSELETYRRKRDFTKTSEPAPRGIAKRAPRGGGRFVVQHHWARREHYDFRIEMEAVLKSWAVTKPPSPDPAVKRLAVRTEDHPLDYATFEGTIPKGEYGGGTVMLWDEGTWQPVDSDPIAALAKGQLKMSLDGERMKGGWVLVRRRSRSQIPHQRRHRPQQERHRGEPAVAQALAAAKGGAGEHGPAGFTPGLAVSAADVVRAARQGAGRAKLAARGQV
jgi:bifunctional non-homologous end joining protein LigD